MANEVSPELLSNLETYLKERERGELSLLSFFYKEVFNRELRTDCGGCVEDGLQHLRSILKNKIKPKMENFKWIGGKKNCIVRIGNGLLIDINENSCTDSLAEAIEFNAKYFHLVERITPKQEEKKSEVKEVLKGLQVTILTSQEVKKEEEEVKKKRGRPKLK